MSYKFEDIVAFMLKKHEGQKDKSGQPYIRHPMFVSSNCKTYEAKVVALLHDVLEDTDATVEDLKKLGLGQKEIDAIVLLTKPEKEDYMHYVKRVAKDPIAREVKMCDLTHNMDLSRLEVVTEKDIRRTERYKQAYEYLKNYKEIARDDIEEER